MILKNSTIVKRGEGVYVRTLAALGRCDANQPGGAVCRLKRMPFAARPLVRLRFRVFVPARA